MRTLKEKSQARAKAQDLQGMWKETMSTMDNEEVKKLLIAKRAEQAKAHDVLYSMTLGQVVTIIKRELHDRGLDYLRVA